MPYDPKSIESICNYAKLLEGKTFKEVAASENSRVSSGSVDVDIYEEKARKGGLGELIEEVYFKILPNNESGPDFKEAGLELKVTPYKKNKNKSFSSKERLVIAMINYFKIVKESFFESIAWDKSENILIIFYLWEEEIKYRLDYRIDYSYLYTPPKEDLKIIIEDYNKIKSKVLEGRAHELSEADTLYLGAVTKAATSRNRTEQPCSDIKAKPRAFSFKNSYMTYVLNNYVLVASVKSTDEKLTTGEEREPFEEHILGKLSKNIGIEDNVLFAKYFENATVAELKAIKQSKGRYSNLAFRMLGIKSNKAEEFIKANIVVKAIRIDLNGKIKESMSFPTFIIKGLIKEKWENSTVRNYFEETKFLFVTFKKHNDGSYYFNNAFFWNMPTSLIDGELKEDWQKIVSTFKEGVELIPKKEKNNKVVVYNSLPGKSEQRILHVRPHATQSYYEIKGIVYGSGKKERDSDELPNGDRMTKQCFWLNNDFVKKIIERG